MADDRLEGELGGDLDDSRRGGAYDMSEDRAADISIDCGRAEELRVIERVESFQPDLQRLGFFHAQVFYSAKLSLRWREMKRGFERSGSSSGSTLRKTRPFERSAYAFSSQSIANSSFPKPKYTVAT